MRRESRLLVADVALCIRKIESFTAGLTLKEYVEDELVRSAVERQFITIGEAIRRLRLVSEETNERIDQAIKISDFRNILVHEYEQVDDKEVWRVMQQALPLLKQQIDAWALELGMEPPPERAS